MEGWGSPRKVMRIVCLSDTHLAHNFRVPPGDMLIHAGDLTGTGSFQEVKTASEWLAALPFKHKVVIAGNHDWLFQRDPLFAKQLLLAYDPSIHYLEDSGVEIEGLKIWGSPWTPYFFNWAFQLPHQHDKWDKIPEGIDILVTHGPSRGILDKTARGEHVGDPLLWKAVVRVRPRLHVFGHIHFSAGKKDIWMPDIPVPQSLVETIFVNAAICDDSYKPTHPPIIIDL